MNKKLFSILLLIVCTQLFSNENFYIFQKGDTLFSLSRKFNVSVKDLIEINNIKNPDKISEGTKIFIPQLYKAQKGDTLYSIAKNSNTTVDEINRLNNFGKDYVLKEGALLVLPSSALFNSTAKFQDKKETGPVNPVETDTPETQLAVFTENPELPFWPHNGKIKKIQGKLTGVQIFGKKGDPVYSVSSGTVVWEGPYRGFGRLVIIQSDKNYIYIYAGNEQTEVKVGDKVAAGFKIGSLGINPHEGKPMLVFSVFKNDKPVNPQDAPRG